MLDYKLEVVFDKKIMNIYHKLIYLTGVFLDFFSAFFINFFSKILFSNKKESLYILILHIRKPWIVDRIIMYKNSFKK